MRNAILLFAALLIGCGAEDPDPKPKPPPSPPAPPPVLVGVIVSPDPAAIGLGEVILFSARGRYSDGSTGPIEVTWTSNPTSVANPFLAPSPEPGEFFGGQAGVAQVTATSTADPSISDTVTLTVSLQPAPQPTIVTLFLPHAYRGVPYQETLQYVNGAGTPTWTIESGALPPGLTLDPATGTISGDAQISPATGNVFPFTVRVTDAAGSDTQYYEFIGFGGIY